MSYSVKDLNLLVLNAGYAIHDGDWNWQNVSSPFTRIYLVTNGTAKVQMPTETIELKPNNLYIIPSFVKHTDICDEHFEHYYLHVYEDVSSEARIFEDWNFIPEIPASEIDKLLFKRICEMDPQLRLLQSNPIYYDNNSSLMQSIIHQKSRKFSCLVETNGIVLQLISRFLSQGQPKDHSTDDRISHVLSYIRKTIDGPIDFEKVVSESCMSKDHFIRVFHRETGETPAHYITRRKLERAQLLLATESLSVKQVAQQLGYYDHSYFIRIFKKNIGVTPIQYRELKKK